MIPKLENKTLRGRPVRVYGCKPVIIGITGNLGSGKTTLARLLEMEYQIYYIIPFGKALKDTVYFAFGVEQTVKDVPHFAEIRPAKEDIVKSLQEGIDNLNLLLKGQHLPELSDEDKAMYMSLADEPDMNMAELHRRLLQLTGTEIFRARDPYYWVKQTNPVVIDKLTRGKLVIIDDVRFLSEAEYVKQMQGILVRMVTPVRKAVATGIAKHKSETEQEQIKVDYTIENEIPNDESQMREHITALAGKAVGLLMDDIKTNLV